MVNIALVELDKYVHQKDLDEYNFDLSKFEPVMLIAPFLRRGKPVVRELTASVVHRNSTFSFRLDATKRVLTQFRFPLDPGFFIKYQDCTFLSTRVRYMLGKNYVIVDAIPFSNDQTTNES